MSKQQALENAINYLLRNWEDAAFYEAGPGDAYQHNQKSAKNNSASIKRDRPGKERAGDFDKRLQKLVEAALSGHLARGDQYRLQQAQAPPGAADPILSDHTVYYRASRDSDINRICKRVIIVYMQVVGTLNSESRT